ncbi:MAG TPA: hypothetical protein VJ890_26495 [Vineibacter sp.]|nr:hypothetical protein [Vineibacter sp.]
MNGPHTEFGRTGREHRDPNRAPTPAPTPAPTSEHFKTHLLRQLPTPTWQGRQTGFPLLADPKGFAQREVLDWGGKGDKDVKTYAFETKPGSVTKFIGVAAWSTRPDAYLIFFRHTALSTDYPGGKDLLEMGIGDYFFGRMQICQQLAASKANVAVILPIAVGSSGEFENNANFVTQCLKEIQASLFGGADGPLLLASYSDGIFRLDSFIKSCRGPLSKVKAIFDFDGSYHVRAGSILLAAPPNTRVFRYDGAHALTKPSNETTELFLARTMAMNPARVPLPRGRRWEKYQAKFGMSHDGWLHYYIPSCMLHHGLDMAHEL